MLHELVDSQGTLTVGLYSTYAVITACLTSLASHCRALLVHVSHTTAAAVHVLNTCRISTTSTRVFIHLNQPSTMSF